MTRNKVSQEGVSLAKEAGGVEAVDRALAILTAFASHDGQMSLAQISEQTGLYKSTVLRIAASLERGGFLSRQENKLYRLGPQLFRLGLLYQRAFKIEDMVRPILRRLVEATGESASFFVRQGDVRLCLFREESQHAVRDHVMEGATLTLERGAAGHVLVGYDSRALPAETFRSRLALLPIVSIGERSAEVAAVAVPVYRRGTAGVELAGALTVSGPRTRLEDRETLARIGATLLEQTRLLSRQLGADEVWRP